MIKIKNVKIFIIIVSIFIVGIFLLLAIFYLYNTPESIPENREKKTVVELDTSDWLIYENKEYGYRFKYPQDLEIIDGKDAQYSFYEFPKSTFIILPAKYPNIKIANYRDPETFQNYQITIVREGNPAQFGKTTEEIIQNFIDPPNPLKQAIKTKNSTIAVYDNSARVYVIGKNSVFGITLDGFDPAQKYVQGWIKDINNVQLTEWVNNYPQYIHILEGIYSTFETF